MISFEIRMFEDWPSFCRLGAAMKTDIPMKWIDEFRDAWRVQVEPSMTIKVLFSAFCLLAATIVRFGFSFIRSEVPYSPYYPAILFATIVGGIRTGIVTAIAGGALGFASTFDETLSITTKASLLIIYLLVSGLVVWGAEHHRLIVSHYRRLSKRLTDEENYRKLVIDELEHRLKNKAVSIQAVMYQILRKQPDTLRKIEDRIVALSSADVLIARADQKGCDLKDLLVSELEPYGVRYILDGDPIFLPAKLASVSTLVIHELGTNAAKYGALSSSTGLLHVEWAMKKDRLNIKWDESGGPIVDHSGEPGFGTKLLKTALTRFDGKVETTYLRSGINCTIDCRVPTS